MSNRQQIRADLDISTYSSVDMPLKDFKAYLDERAASIAADNETGNVYIEYEDDPYDGGGYLKAWVWRWETDAELAEREHREEAERAARAAAHAAERERTERAALAALKAKYGDT